MDKIRIGILGATRGLNFALSSLFDHPRAEVAAICDRDEPLLGRVREALAAKGLRPRLCTSFDELLETDVDGVILCNYANEHAPYAIRALRAGKHVLSEVLPTQNLAEAVALCEAVEETGKLYQYAENYCFSDQTLEMKRRFEQGDIGDLVSAECDFINDCSTRWHLLTRGDPNHWRNLVPSTFYCTHSIGPLLYVTGRRAVSVVGMEPPPLEATRSRGARNGGVATELLRLDDGTFARSLHGNLKRPFLSRLRTFGTKGTMEHELGPLRVDVGVPDSTAFKTWSYLPRHLYAKERLEGIDFGLDRGTVRVLECFLDSILGDEEAMAMAIDLYRALDMSLPGLLAYRSILNGAVPVEVPDFRDRTQRERYRDDTACTDPKIAGEALQPSCSTFSGEVPEERYRREKERYERAQRDAFHLGFN